MLQLTGLTALDVDTAKALAKFTGNRLFLGGLTALDADTAIALAEFKGGCLHLDGLTTLDADAAKALAECQCRMLSLDGLTMLHAETAKALAEFEGGCLTLDRLTRLDVATAKALVEFTGELRLQERVTDSFLMENPLTSDTALARAALAKGNLFHVTTLDSPDSVAIAQALATRKGPLSLPNLKKISPKTLTALLKKKDVDIPLIETLELIQEPDGSVT